MWRGRTGDGKKSRIVELSIRLMECKFVCFFSLLVLAGKYCVFVHSAIFFCRFHHPTQVMEHLKCIKILHQISIFPPRSRRGLVRHMMCARSENIDTKSLHTHWIHSSSAQKLTWTRAMETVLYALLMNNEHTLKKRVYFVQTLREELAAEWEMENAIQLKFFFQWFSVFLLVFISYKHVSFFFHHKLDS